MKKFLLWAIIFSLLIPVFSLADKKDGEQDLLMGILKEAGGEFLEGDINIGGVIINEFIDGYTMESMGEEIKSEIGIVGKKLEENRGDYPLEGNYYSKEFIEEEGFNQLTIWGYDTNMNPTTIILSSYLDKETSKGETSLFINLIKKEQILDLNGIIEEMESIFTDFNKPAEITTCIIGTFDGELEGNVREEKAIKAIKKAKGKVKEKYVDPSIVSFTAYTPYIDKFIYSGNKKVNLNVAIRYNEYEDKTYFWIGTPIITIGY
jgi:hypothetical protein